MYKQSEVHGGRKRGRGRGGRGRGKVSKIQRLTTTTTTTDTTPTSSDDTYFMNLRGITTLNLKTFSSRIPVFYKMIEYGFMFESPPILLAIQEVEPKMLHIKGRVYRPLPRVHNPDSIVVHLASFRWRNMLQYVIHLLPTNQSMCFLTTELADEIVLLRVKRDEKRPLFGLRYGTFYVFNVHMFDECAETYLVRILRYMMDKPNADWFILGTFNCRPFVLREQMRKKYPKYYNDVAFDDNDGWNELTCTEYGLHNARCNDRFYTIHRKFAISDDDATAAAATAVTNVTENATFASCVNHEVASCVAV